ncbi:MAG: hypothetical protein V4501_09470 [Pseudomonadota bacterium]
MGLARNQMIVEQREIDEVNALQTLIQKNHVLYYSKNYAFETLRVSIEREYNDFLLALALLRRSRTTNASLINDAIDTTVTNAFELAKELILENNLNISANKALPMLTSHIHQIIKTIEEPGDAQSEALNKSIRKLQNNLLDPLWQRSPIIGNLIAATFGILALSCLLAVVVASPILLAVGVSDLLGTLIFGLALPTLMACPAFVGGGVFIYSYFETKYTANSKITLFGASAKPFLQPDQEIEPGAVNSLG